MLRVTRLEGCNPDGLLAAGEPTTGPGLAGGDEDGAKTLVSLGLAGTGEGDGDAAAVPARGELAAGGLTGVQPETEAGTLAVAPFPTGPAGWGRCRRRSNPGFDAGPPLLLGPLETDGMLIALLSGDDEGAGSAGAEVARRAIYSPVCGCHEVL